jgi:hypothetical protein
MSSRLYMQALEVFRKEAEDRYRGDAKDMEILREFLREKATPEESKKAAEDLRADAGKKYGSKKVGDTVIPDTWISNIMGNINNFVTVGNYAMKGAPESVGLAWFAVRLTLSAIQNNYDLYNFFGSGLTDISEIMIIIPHYDRLYDETKNPEFKPSPVVDKLFKDIITAYAAVLKFSLSIKRHLTAGTLARIRHGFKDFFGGQKGKFQGQLEGIGTLKMKILENSEAAFQDRTLHGIESVQGVMASVQKTVQDIKGFQSTLETFHKEQTAQLDLLLKKVEDIKATTKPKTPWDIALQEFEKNKDILSPSKESVEALGEALDQRFPGTCQWVFEDPYYLGWEQSSTTSILCYAGQQGK